MSGNTQNAFNYNNLKVTELKDILRARKLKVSGLKKELVQRLVDDDVAKGGQPASPTQSTSVVSTPAKSSKARSPRVQRTPKESLEIYIRDSNLPLGEVLEVIRKVYGLEETDDLDETPDLAPVELEVPKTKEELAKLRVKELKVILKKQGKRVSGKKDDLIERILAPRELPKVNTPSLPSANSNYNPPQPVFQDPPQLSGQSSSQSSTQPNSSRNPNSPFKAPPIEYMNDPAFQATQPLPPIPGVPETVQPMSPPPLNNNEDEDDEDTVEDHSPYMNTETDYDQIREYLEKEEN